MSTSEELLRKRMRELTDEVARVRQTNADLMSELDKYKDVVRQYMDELSDTKKAFQEELKERDKLDDVFKLAIRQRESVILGLAESLVEIKHGSVDTMSSIYERTLYPSLESLIAKYSSYTTYSSWMRDGEDE